ncbi:MAG: flagellin FliC [Nitrospirae bacterium]|nr:flagellin FliC [Nitrospirota bacterium]
MSLIINTNMASIAAQNNLTISSNKLQDSVERLSSGLRIVKAADDAAGLALSEKMRAKIRASAVALRNANDGVSMLQTAEGALNEVSSILVRMRELATQAASPSLGASERATINDEFVRLKSEIDRIAQVTEFNGQVLVNGALSSSSLAFQVGIGATANDTIAATVCGATTAALSVDTQIVTAAAEAKTALQAVESAIGIAAGIRGTIGANQSRLFSAISNLRVSEQNLQAAESRIRDADFSYETAMFTKNQIMVQAGTAILGQANLMPQAALQLLK